ncbi:MAG: outer membrane beta-barrel protein, partial [Chitinophagaceae bacterium]
AGTVSVGYWPDKWLNFWTDFEFAVNNTKSSLNKGFNTKFWQINSNANISMKLPKKFYVEINGNVNIYQRTAAFANTPNLFIINAHVKKTFPKSTEKFEVKLAVNDLLNQNQGINRNISSNFIAETQNVVLRRFVLFSFAMNISKNAKPNN